MLHPLSPEPGYLPTMVIRSKAQGESNRVYLMKKFTQYSLQLLGYQILLILFSKLHSNLERTRLRDELQMKF